jgi:uncharacterized protein (TIGR00255 family)
MKSMTAYGRASGDFSFGKLLIEIQSVNRKILDVLVNLPKDFFRFDILVRKWISAQIERGQVSVRVMLITQDKKANVQARLSELKSLQKEWHHVASQLGFNPQESVNLSFLLGQLQENTQLEVLEHEELYAQSLESVFKEALNAFMKMKVEEAELLKIDLEKRLESITQKLTLVEARKESVIDKYRKKIRERLLEIGQITPELEEKILRELALLAERIDVTEEVVRLNAHIEQFARHLQIQDKAVGRTLEFLTQEMLRETNTLGAKANDTEVSTVVIFIKSELEKIREQILNLE